MNKILFKSALTLSTLLLSAVPAFSSSLSFNFSGTYGTYDTSGGNLIAGTQLNLASIVDGYNSNQVIAASDLYLASVTGSVETWQVWTGANQTGTELLAFTAQTTLNSNSESFSNYVGVLSNVNGVAGIANGQAIVASGAFGGVTNANGTGAVSSAVLSVSKTPEPASLFMLTGGLVGVGLLRRRSVRRSA